MIRTSLSSTLAGTVEHRVSGLIEQLAAEQGAAEALGVLQELSRRHGSLKLLLDLRNAQFATLLAQKAWNLGFVRNPAVREYVHAVAILADDSPSLHAEQVWLSSERVQFFSDDTAAANWLAQM